MSPWHFYRDITESLPMATVGPLGSWQVVCIMDSLLPVSSNFGYGTEGEWSRFLHWTNNIFLWQNESCWKYLLGSYFRVIGTFYFSPNSYTLVSSIHWQLLDSLGWSLLNGDVQIPLVLLCLSVVFSFPVYHFLFQLLLCTMKESWTLLCIGCCNLWCRLCGGNELSSLTLTGGRWRWESIC